MAPKEVCIHQLTGRFEDAADDGADEEDDDEALLIEAVERDGEEHGPEAVDGAEGPEEQARAVLVHAGVDPDHVEDDLDDEPSTQQTMKTQKRLKKLSLI